MIDTAKRARLAQTLRVAPGPVADAIAARRSAAERAAHGLWRRDPGVWSADSDTQQKIANRLGWLSSPKLMMASIDRLQKFAAAVKADGITDVVLLGMGGSSLAPEVIRAVLGTASGWPRFHMLDSTDPAAVAATVEPGFSCRTTRTTSRTTTVVGMRIAERRSQIRRVRRRRSGRLTRVF